MPAERPLLTIAIPTFNRSRYLAELLDVLAPQLTEEAGVELLISDNASTDDTPCVVDGFRQRGLTCRYVRNEVNIGADGNFLQCFRQANGEYFWLFGDDDIIVPGGLRKILSYLRRDSWDLVFVRPYAFRKDFDERDVHDPLGRTALKVCDPNKFADLTGTMLTFISALIVNKEKLLRIHAPDPADLLGTGLIQLGWVLPLLGSYERGLVIYGGQVAGRAANSGGYALTTVFGKNLKKVTLKLLSNCPDVADRIVNSTLRGWFPGTIVEARRRAAGDFGIEDFHQLLKPVFGENPRYWVFVYPVTKLPIIVANAVVGIQTRFIFRIQAALEALAGVLFLRSDFLDQPRN